MVISLVIPHIWFKDNLVQLISFDFTERGKKEGGGGGGGGGGGR